MPMAMSGLPWWLNGKESTCQSRRRGFDPWVGKIPWRRKWQPTLIFLPGKSHGQRSLEDYSPWDHERAGHDFKTEKQQSLGRDRATAAYAIKQPSKQREMGEKLWIFSPSLSIWWARESGKCSFLWHQFGIQNSGNGWERWVVDRHSLLSELLRHSSPLKPALNFVSWVN